jgi:cell division protein YceG involved in septum cleavage
MRIVSPTELSLRTKFWVRIFFVFLLLILTTLSASTIFLLKTKIYIFDEVTVLDYGTTPIITPFPIGVNPDDKEIAENPTVDDFFSTYISSTVVRRDRDGWIGHLVARLAQLDWYQNLASPTGRILVIFPGERKEQVVNNFGKILRWDANERELFATLVTGSLSDLPDGTFFPGRYTTHKDATPSEIANMINERFELAVNNRYSPEVAAQVPLKDALIIASLIEREAYDFTDMRYISGVIWNRLFINMNLQLDASLQYAKGSRTNQPWWPVVRPNDKYIASPYNTYANSGLPPAPIANPSLEAILATLNPRETDCLFYFHDSQGGFHCNETYEEHVAELRQIYGRGR